MANEKVKVSFRGEEEYHSSDPWDGDRVIFFAPGGEDEVSPQKAVQLLSDRDDFSCDDEKLEQKAAEAREREAERVQAEAEQAAAEAAAEEAKVGNVDALQARVAELETELAAKAEEQSFEPPEPPEPEEPAEPKSKSKK
jgi:hypothetical protein